MPPSPSVPGSWPWRSIRCGAARIALKRSTCEWSRNNRRCEVPLDHELIGVDGEPRERSWTATEAILYALGVGAGLGNPTRELEFTTENSVGITQKVLPTFGVILARGQVRSLGDFNPAMLVHGEQGITVHGPIPVEGTVRATSKVTGIYDKGSGALVQTESR